ncbi:MDR family MFS transporter [Tsukamurella ocularis]|uniref:MDR family MFS transporter n=1 Tax=Tsukamurella ocularis TaxID=1970234 RepID=UPI002167356A|nr:MDR family MFS transporter [Tsukamurella ocularis]MCS3781616.1 EmrB/QacA subfamily drug resistance transporter [Tsukamurella ocularis]MCS3788110.1 EmrB/QacA subfamily drug resistance transporter [Tsukamurella ocularis]MCS3851830.1 EmrB/QacA subfamily drug resistance transporter [Tsukamurella ocularis]
MSEITAEAEPQASAPMTHREILEVMAGLLAALFTALLSTTVVSTALPRIISDLGASTTAFSWVITTALLANAASTPIWGKLADLFNKKTLVQSAIVIFVAGSVLAGATPNIEVLLVARVIQGIGMGGLTALVVAIMGSIIPPRERGRYSGYMGAVMAVSMAGGPILGGVITDHIGWRWCFYISIPVAVAALALIQRTLHLPTTRNNQASIDWLGATLLTAGVSVLLIWVSFAGKNYDWLSTSTAVYLVSGLALLVATVYVESRAKEPVIPLKIITEKTTGLAIIASIAVGVGMFGAMSFLGLYFQNSRGYSPTMAGVLTIPMVLGMLISSVASGQLITRTGQWKRYVVGGAVILVIGFALLSTIDHLTPIWQVQAYIAVMGFGIGALMQNLVLAVQNTVSVQNIGAASSSVAFFRTFGGAIGVSALGAVLTARVTDLVKEGVVANHVRDPHSPLIREITNAAFGDATGRIFLVSTACAIVTLIAVALLPNKPLRTTIDLESGADATPAGDADSDAPTSTDAVTSAATAADDRPRAGLSKTN